MTCTTWLRDSELNLPLPDPLPEVLGQARKATGEDWQVVPVQVTTGRVFKKTLVLYGLFVFVGGVGPWQQINFFVGDSKSSLNMYVLMELVVAYLYGLCAGAEILEISGARP